MADRSAVELKGGMYTLMSLQIHSVDPIAIELALRNKIQQAPGFFKGTPIIVDLTMVEHMEELDTANLVKCIMDHGLRPIAARAVDKASPAAASIKLPILDAQPKRKAEKPLEPDATSEETELVEAAAIEMDIPKPMIITRPVRSGQQIYAQGSELVVLAQAGPGAELLSDNNIHVYGPLRGRALCGVSGNTEARIFCQSLEAELVSVAGTYRPLEEIPSELKGKPAQIRLDGDKLVIEAL